MIFKLPDIKLYFSFIGGGGNLSIIIKTKAQKSDL